MSYFRNVGSRAFRTRNFVHKRKVKNHLHADEIRVDTTERTDYGFRLSCGHVMNGDKCVGKKKVRCYFCEWADQGHDFADQSRSGWQDIDEAAYEAKRREAQS